jgi:hypothetical protein
MVAITPDKGALQTRVAWPCERGPVLSTQDLIIEADKMRAKLVQLLDEVTDLIARTHQLLRELEVKPTIVTPRRFMGESD